MTTISKMITELLKLQDQYGPDMPIGVFDSIKAELGEVDSSDQMSIAGFGSSNGKMDYLLILDKELTSAFYDYKEGEDSGSSSH